MYKVIKLFTDLQDDNYKYEVGDEYPRLGLQPSLARIEELKGSDNKQGTPLIEEVEDMPFSDDAVTDEDVKAEEPKEEPLLKEELKEEPKAKAGTKNSTRGKGKAKK